MRRFTVPAVIATAAVALLVVLAVAISGQKSNNSIAYAVASRHYRLAPDAHTQLPVLSGLDGARTRSLANFRGRVVLVNFFAGWCDGCQQEVRVMARAQKLLAAHGGTVVGIAYQDAPADALAFMRRYHEHYPVLQDPAGHLASAYNLGGYIPDSYVIAADGKIEAWNDYPLTMGWLKRDLMPILNSRA